MDVDTGQTKEVSRKGVKKRVPVTEKRQVHRVQILDPATGTGTFLAEVVKQITPRIKAVNEGGWSQYVEQDLLPRLHGFELLMASYAMCHMKLDMMLTDTGYVPTSEKPPRLSVYLTNSLEQGERIEADLFPMTRWLSEEAAGASEIKRDKPIMCIIGNPPYSGISQNMGDFATSLIEPYKYVDGVHFGERKHWLHDDYVKFIAMAERLIKKNGEGILGFITNNSYIDNPTFNGMRWHLQNTFDTVRVINLHGSMKRRDNRLSTEGDENVFDIQQGVAIIIATLSPSQNTEKKVFAKSIRGKRKEKYKDLFQLKLSNIETEVLPTAPYFLFEPKSNNIESWTKSFPLSALFINSLTGVQTSRDKLAVADNNQDLKHSIATFISGEKEDAERLFGTKNTSFWNFETAKETLVSLNGEFNLKNYLYRPFDIKKISYLDAIIHRRKASTMRHLINDNFALVLGRQGLAVGGMEWNLVYISDSIFDLNMFYRGGGKGHPLYLYPDPDDLDQTRRVNMDPKIRKAIETAAEHPSRGRPDEVAIFDYIYGVLHCPAYRETYAEFLKIDFPRVPYPASPDRFWDIAAKGEALRTLHLMDGVDAGLDYPFKGSGDSVVGRMNAKSYKMTDDAHGQVWINDDQYFDAVPRRAWEFYIGGYQPAQKWLKDRKGRALSFDDVMHYRKIIHILLETGRIMDTIKMDLG